MSGTPSERLEILFEQAVSVPVAERAAFLERETSDDPALRAELVSLLEHSDGAAEYLGRLQSQVLGSEVGGMLRDPSAMADAPDPWIGSSVSHYAILDRIGGGGMGVVYRARDTTLDREVALKFIAPELRRDSHARRRFQLEAQAASRIDHPNICTVHEIAETADGRLFIVMAAYDGETLRARIDRGALPEAEALALAGQVARALAAAHERGIVHRDVKPDNVFITRDGVVKLLDFGLAHATDSAMSGAGAAGGTVAYMSPEQASGSRADEQSDVWALGVMLFEMLAGTRPYIAEGAPATIELILSAEPDLQRLPPGTRPASVNVIRRALSRDRATRYANGREILAAITAAGSGATSRGTWRKAALAAIPLIVVGAVMLRARVLTPSSADAEDKAAPPTAHVLWVDDDPTNNRFIIDQFERRGVQVTMALNTAAALEQYSPHAYDLVISDMGRYEGVNGAYVARAGLNLLEGLRARDPDVQVVFCTSARALTEFRDSALAAGARDIVTECEVILRYLGIEPQSPR